MWAECLQVCHQLCKTFCLWVRGWEYWLYSSHLSYSITLMLLWQRPSCALKSYWASCLQWAGILPIFLIFQLISRRRARSKQLSLISGDMHPRYPAHVLPNLNLSPTLLKSTRLLFLCRYTFSGVGIFGSDARVARISTAIIMLSCLL